VTAFDYDLSPFIAFRDRAACKPHSFRQGLPAAIARAKSVTDHAADEINDEGRCVEVLRQLIKR